MTAACVDIDSLVIGLSKRVVCASFQVKESVKEVSGLDVAFSSNFQSLFLEQSSELFPNSVNTWA